MHFIQLKTKIKIIPFPQQTARRQSNYLGICNITQKMFSYFCMLMKQIVSLCLSGKFILYNGEGENMSPPQKMNNHCHFFLVSFQTKNTADFCS